MQFRLEESPAYKELASGRSSETATKPRSPIVAVLLKFPSRILLAGAAFVAMNACFYIMITFAMSYGTIELGFDRSALLMAVLIGSVFMIPALFVAAAWSDRWGRIGVYAIGAVLSGIWAFAFFPLLQTGSTIAAIFAVSIGLSLLAMMYGPQAALFAELFPVEMRYSGASLGYQLGAVLGGGFAPMIATALFAKFQTTMSISIYLAVLCLISLISILALRSHK